MRKPQIAVLVIALAGFLATTTRADTIVSYYTTGEFASTHSSTVTFSNSDQAQTITFVGTTFSSLEPTDVLVDAIPFGTFSWTTASAKPADVLDDAFTLLIHQSAPPAGTSGVIATAHATVNKNKLADFQVNWDSSATIPADPPNVTYTIDDVHVNNQPLGSGSAAVMGTLTLHAASTAPPGTVTPAAVIAVPLPAAVWPALAMLAGLAVVARHRQQRMF